ncbi:MAG: hypothetical protein ACTSWY_08765 [Promethearchaeota archaeon]
MVRLVFLLGILLHVLEYLSRLSFMISTSLILRMESLANSGSIIKVNSFVSSHFYLTLKTNWSEDDRYFKFKEEYSKNSRKENFLIPIWKGIGGRHFGKDRIRVGTGKIKKDKDKLKVNFNNSVIENNLVNMDDEYDIVLIPKENTEQHKIRSEIIGNRNERDLYIYALGEHHEQEQRIQERTGNIDKVRPKLLTLIDKARKKYPDRVPSLEELRQKIITGDFFRFHVNLEGRILFYNPFGKKYNFVTTPEKVNYEWQWKWKKIEDKLDKSKLSKADIFEKRKEFFKDCPVAIIEGKLKFRKN